MSGDVLDLWEREAAKVTIRNDYGTQARRVLCLIAAVRKYRRAVPYRGPEGQALLVREAEALLSGSEARAEGDKA